VRAPNWGYVYDRTVHDLAKTLSLAPYAEPKIEPEIHRRALRRALTRYG
jgi:2-keto-4-pentenoate hydratase